MATLPTLYGMTRRRDRETFAAMLRHVREPSDEPTEAPRELVLLDPDGVPMSAPRRLTLRAGHAVLMHAVTAPYGGDDRDQGGGPYG